MVGEVMRQVDAQLQRDVRTGTAEASSLTVVRDFLARFQLNLGKPGDNTSIGNVISALGDTFRTLATAPESVTAQSAVVTQAQSVAGSLNRLADAVQAQRNEAERGITASVAGINQYLDDIATLNQQIVTAGSTGRSTADLEDQRDVKLDALSKEIGINYFKRDTGEVTITTASGRTLLDGVVHHITFAAVSQVTAAATYPGTLAGPMLDGIDLFKAPPVTPPSTEIASGRLAGLADLRDRILPQAERQLDELAASITTTLSGLTPPLELFQDAGATYNAANLAGYAQRITVNTAVINQPWRLRDGTAVAGPNTATPSDATLPRAVIDAFDTVQTFPAGTGLGTLFTFSQYGASFVGFQAAQAQSYSDRVADQEAINDQLTQTLTGESGVNVDQEMALMVQLQNSYSANARVVSTIKDMFDALLAIKS
jgi:flagellar hook-associated protein 1 FlgK